MSYQNRNQRNQRNQTVYDEYLDKEITPVPDILATTLRGKNVFERKYKHAFDRESVKKPCAELLM